MNSFLGNGLGIKGLNEIDGKIICSYYFDHYIISSFFLSNCSSYYYPFIDLYANSIIPFGHRYALIYSYALTHSLY
jgi:hypothetical protein